MAIDIVFFDCGETLVDETRMWAGWAAYLGVSDHDFMAALGDVIARGAHHHQVFKHFQSDFEFDRASRQRQAGGDSYLIEQRDLYPDAASCLTRTRAAGYRVGIAANQPAAASDALARLGLAYDHLAISQVLGVSKPDPAFFQKLVELADCPPERIAYVGDRLDNDILPAKAAGMTAIFIVRGPWGRHHANAPECHHADLIIDSLDELPERLEQL